MAEQTNEMAAKSAGLGYPSQEPVWEDLKDSEKIERMRGIIKQLQSHLANVQEDMEVMNSHRHEEDGAIVFRIPIAESWKLKNRHGFGAKLSQPNWF